MLKKIFFAAILMMSVSAYSQGGTTVGTTPPQPSATTVQSDAEIARVLTTINEAEIDAANYAMGKVKNKDVKEYAKMMSKEHKNNTTETKKIAKMDLKADVEKSDLVKSLKEDAKMSKDKLKAADKASIDRTYIDEQVMMHEKALSLIDGTLLPSAQSDSMKQHLQKTRTAVSAHLTQAQGLKSKME